MGGKRVAQHVRGQILSVPSLAAIMGQNLKETLPAHFAAMSIQKQGPLALPLY